MIFMIILLFIMNIVCAFLICDLFLEWSSIQKKKKENKDIAFVKKVSDEFIDETYNEKLLKVLEALCFKYAITCSVQEKKICSYKKITKMLKKQNKQLKRYYGLLGGKDEKDRV